MAKIKPGELWEKCTDLLFDRSDRWGPLNEAMRASVVVAVEGHTLIVGMSGEDQHLRGHLETAQNRHQVLTCLKELTGRELDYQMIHGTTAEDWEMQRQARDTQVERPASSAQAEPAGGQALEVEEPPAEAPGDGPWASMMERLHYAYRSVQGRTQPTVRARLLMDALPMLAEAESKAAQQGEPEERIQRSLTRAIERVATLVDLSATQVALELLRHQSAAPPKKTGRKKK